MSGSVNRVILLGRCVRDPETRALGDGTRVVNFSVVTSDKWRDRQSGEIKENSQFHRIAVFNEKLVELCEKYVHKGSKLYVEGALQTRKFTNSSGQEQTSTEVVLQKFGGNITLLDDPPPVRDDRVPQRSASPVSYDRAGPPRRVTNDVDDRGIPF